MPPGIIWQVDPLRYHHHHQEERSVSRTPSSSCTASYHFRSFSCSLRTANSFSRRFGGVPTETEETEAGRRTQIAHTHTETTSHTHTTHTHTHTNTTARARGSAAHAQSTRTRRQGGSPTWTNGIAQASAMVNLSPTANGPTRTPSISSRTAWRPSARSPPQTTRFPTGRSLPLTTARQASAAFRSLASAGAIAGASFSAM
mmetsp:Transcript_14674/g.35813  ORF Transcript_14674/g.35813 Transcript_14674/m.35813 type:complete len:201 (+) Transcript_14674:108-710(+)